MNKLKSILSNKLLIILGILIFVMGGTVGYIIGNDKNEDVENQYVCRIYHHDGSEYTIWVDPEYNEFPEFYAVEKTLERYNITVTKNIDCSVVR